MKKYIIGFILGIIISGIGVYAITASEVTYHDTDIESALDNLYNNIGKIDLSKLTFSANSYQGAKTMGSSTSIELTSGNYIVVGIEAYSSPVASNQGTTGSHTTVEHPGINQASKCEKLGSMASATVPGGMFDNKYQRLYLQTYLWKCSFDETTTVTITEDSMGASHNNLPLSVMVEAIKLD